VTLLAPEIVETVLDGRQTEGLRLEVLLDGFPVEWAGQSRALGFAKPQGPALSCGPTQLPPA
jgi:hypothetical protein